MMKATVSYQDKRHPILRVYNWIGQLFLESRLPWINLEEENLIATAKRRAKFDDFGEDTFLEPFRVILDAAKREAHLTFAGKVIARGSAVMGLAARLSMQREVAEHPEILDQPVPHPLIVVGMPRSGTSLLHHLLAQDPQGRPLIAWETISPAPIGMIRPGRKDLRSFMTRFAVWMSKNVLAPETAGMHTYTHNGPAECTALIWPSFVWPMGLVLPSVHKWLEGSDEDVYDYAYSIYRLALQVLHWQRPATGHWVLKSPQHVWAMDSLARAVPEASIVQTHRNMNDVLPSLCSLSAAMMSVYTDTIEAKNVGPGVLEYTGEAMDRMLDARTKIDNARITDIRYEDLVADPIAAIRRIYEEQDFPYTEEFERRMSAWLDRDKKRQRPKHIYSHERFGLDADGVTSTFANYHEKFGII